MNGPDLLFGLSVHMGHSIDLDWFFFFSFAMPFCCEWEEK